METIPFTGVQFGKKGVLPVSGNTVLTVSGFGWQLTISEEEFEWNANGHVPLTK